MTYQELHLNWERKTARVGEYEKKMEHSAFNNYGTCPKDRFEINCMSEEEGCDECMQRTNLVMKRR